MTDGTDLAARLSAAKERCIWIQVGSLLDGESGAPVRDAHVVFDSDTIRFVGSASRFPPRSLLNAGQERPDLVLKDHTLLPGLIDSHVHLFLDGGELDPEVRKKHLYLSPDRLLEQAKARLRPLVAFGVTAVRDAGDRHGVGLEISRLYRSGAWDVMPYVDSPGAALHRSGRYGSFMAEPVEAYATLAECVKARVRTGAFRIKILATGIIDFKEGGVTSEPQFTTEELTDLIRAAKHLGKQTFAHASGEQGIERVVEGAVDSVEHGYFVSEDQLARMRDRQIAWVPTFAPVRAQIDHADRLGWDQRVVSNLKKILDAHAASLRRAHELGVRILAGSDAGSYAVPHGEGLIQELELIEAAGIPTISVVHAATGNPASSLAFGERFGRIRQGYRSRFILTPFSPIEAVSNLRKERILCYDGNVFCPNR